MYNVSARWTVNTDKFTLFVYSTFLVFLSAPLSSQNINNQIVTIAADETLTDYSFRSRYDYTKSKNYLKRRYRIRHWISMFIGTPCTSAHSPNSWQLPNCNCVQSLRFKYESYSLDLISKFCKMELANCSNCSHISNHYYQELTLETILAQYQMFGGIKTLRTRKPVLRIRIRWIRKILASWIRTRKIYP